MRLLSLYDSYEFIPVYNFYRASETDDLRYLLRLKRYDRLPNVDMSKHNETWEKILEEHRKITGDNNYLTIFYKICEYHQILNKYNNLSNMLFTLNYRPNKGYIQDLKENGYHISIKSDKEYRETLNVAKHRIENLCSKMEIVEHEIEQMTKGQKNESYHDLVAAVRIEAGVIDIHNTTMPEFVFIINNLKKRVKNARDNK